MLNGRCPRRRSHLSTFSLSLFSCLNLFHNSLRGQRGKQGCYAVPSDDDEDRKAATTCASSSPGAPPPPPQQLDDDDGRGQSGFLLFSTASADASAQH